METSKYDQPLEDSISVSEIFSTLLRFKFTVFFFLALFISLALIKSYLTTNFYVSKATVTLESPSNTSTLDILSQGGGNPSLENELALISSRSIALRALEGLNIGTRYFAEHNYKTFELYKDTPFIVNIQEISTAFQGRAFYIIPIDKVHFRLQIIPSKMQTLSYEVLSVISPRPKPYSYDEIHEYNKQITTSNFSFTINKIREFDQKKYLFTIKPNKNMVGFIRSHLGFDQSYGFGSVMGITFQDSVPQRAQDILKAITNAYLSQSLEEKAQSAKQQLRFIDSQLDAIEKTLKKSANAVQNYKSTNILVDIGTKAGITAAKLNDVEQQKYNIDIQISILTNILDFIKTHESVDGIDLGGSSDETGPIQTIITQMQELASRRTSLLVDYTEAHPDIVKINEQLLELKKTLVNSLKGSLRNLNDRRAILEDQIEEQKSAMRALPEQERELERLNRSFKANEDIYSYLLNSRAQTAILEASTVPKAKIIDEPSFPYFPAGPKRKMTIIFGVLLGLIFGISIALMRGFLDKTIKTKKQITMLTKLPIYGIVPNKFKKRVEDAYIESLRVIRTNMEFSSDSIQSKIVTITSSVASEGKTTLSGEIAKTLAKANKKVILVDLDMRRSRLHEELNVSNHTGMSSLLTQQDTITNVIQKTPIENLHIITSGPLPPNPSELILSQSLLKTLDILKKNYDYIILDSPPIGLVSDAVAVMRQSAINLLVVRANFSKKPFIKQINRFVERNDLKHCGIILNGADLHEIGDGYGYGYGYNKNVK